MKKGIIIGVILAAFVAIAVYFYVFNKPARTAAAEDAEFDVTVSELLNEFETDEVAANAKYLDKIIRVHGRLESIYSAENDISIYLQNAGGAGGVTCSFSKEDLDITNLIQGQKIAIKGICSGYLLDVVLNKCIVDTLVTK